MTKDELLSQSGLESQSEDLAPKVTELRAQELEIEAQNASLRELAAELEAERRHTRWLNHEKQRLEQANRQLQKLQVVGRLASGIVHDFNNLLMGAQGCIDIARTKLDAGHPGYRFLDEAKRSIANGASITRPLLSFIRQQEATLKSLELDAVIERNREMLRRLLDASIDLKIHTGAPGAKVSCLEGSLEQILLNLLANARETLSSGCGLSIESQVVTAYEQTPLRSGRYVTLRVKTRGPAQAHGETQAAALGLEKGNALGFSVVHNIVKNCSGHIEVSGEGGADLVLTIYLPLTEPAFEAPSPALGGPSTVTGPTILIIDEPSAILPDLRRSLEKMGCQVLEASTITQAMDLCRRTRVDLILADVSRPGVRGGQFLDEAKALRPGLAIIYMSAASDGAPPHGGQLEPGVIWLRKPLTEQLLHASLQLALGGGRASG